MAEELTAEETEIYSDLAEQAGVVARRLLAERGLIYLEDLAPEDARLPVRGAARLHPLGRSAYVICGPVAQFAIRFAAPLGLGP